jgi:hypothetical protein
MLNMTRDYYEDDFKRDIKIFIKGYRKGVVDFLPIIRRITEDTYHMALYKEAIREMDYEENNV